MLAGDDTAARVHTSYQRTLAPGEVVFDEGDPADRLYVIRSGEVELVRENAAGKRAVARLGAGDFFGELGVVLGAPRTARAVAVSQTRLIALDRTTLEGMIVDQPEIAIRMIRVLVSRLIEAERRLAGLGVDDLLRPVVRALLRHGQPEGKAGLRVAIKLREIAQTAGLSMLEAHRAVHQLLDRELLELANDEVVVPDREALCASLDAAAD
ncbi:MAG TPA: Crp/Fnr family transcriptional regulator [Myxococcota bacterium]|nr:Crp/Fnr family transcriptional regulator [Myxococcota bacterium]